LKAGLQAATRSKLAAKVKSALQRVIRGVRSFIRDL
jgi:hypothetical protein